MSFASRLAKPSPPRAFRLTSPSLARLSIIHRATPPASTAGVCRVTPAWAFSIWANYRRAGSMSGLSYIDAAAVGIGKAYDELFKVLLIGNSGVGKSSMVNKYLSPEVSWDPTFITTIGVDFKIKTCIYRGKDGSEKTVKLQIWDTAGQERFRAITTSYYRGANGIILTYSLDDPESVRAIEHTWLSEVERYAHPDARLILVGNKSDLQPDPVVRSMAASLADRYKGKIVAHIETSAKTGSNVSQSFLSLVEGMMHERLSKAMADVGKKDEGRKRLTSSVVVGEARTRSSCAC